MTAKRFIIMDNLPKGTHSNIWDKQKQHNQGIGDELWLGEVVAMLNEGVILAEENEQLKQFKENVIKWVDSQMKFNVKKYIETEDSHFKSENIDLHNFKVFIGIDSND